MQEFRSQRQNLISMLRNLAFLSVLVLCVSCSSIKGDSGKTVYRDGQPAATHVPDGDPEMAAAEATARESLPEFIAELKKELAKPTTQLEFSIKTAFPHDDSFEHMWVDVERFENGVFHGTLGNEPLYVKNLKVGDAVQVKQDEIEDWIIVDDAGNMRGGFTAKLLMEREEAKGK